MNKPLTPSLDADAIPTGEELAAAYGVKLMDVLAASLDA